MNDETNTEASETLQKKEETFSHEEVLELQEQVKEEFEDRQSR